MTPAPTVQAHAEALLNTARHIELWPNAYGMRAHDTNVCRLAADALRLLAHVLPETPQEVPPMNATEARQKAEQNLMPELEALQAQFAEQLAGAVGAGALTLDIEVGGRLIPFFQPWLNSQGFKHYALNFDGSSAYVLTVSW